MTEVAQALRDKTAVCGVGLLLGDFPDRTALSLAVETYQMALADAGMKREDVDGIIQLTYGYDYDRFLEAVGTDVRYANQGWAHGRFIAPMMQQAAMVVATGMAKAVAIVHGRRRKAYGQTADHEMWRQGLGPHGESPAYGALGPVFGAAIAAQRYFHMYGGSNNDLAPIAVALRKAKVELRKLERLTQAGRLPRSKLEGRVRKALAREHLASFVVTSLGGDEESPTFNWRVDAALRRKLERTRLGRRVLCTDRHLWSTGRLVQAFRGQWKVEELFRRAKKGGLVPWGPSYQWADGSLQLHTFATVVGLTLVSLARIALGTNASARAMMQSLAAIRVTLVRTATGGVGRRPTAMLAPELTAEQRRAVKVFELERWFPHILSCMTARPLQT